MGTAYECPLPWRATFMRACPVLRPLTRAALAHAAAAVADVSASCYGDTDDVLTCEDGSTAIVLSMGDGGWDRCSAPGNARARCPRKWPFMCTKIEAGVGGSAAGDRRCVKSAAACANHGGARSCDAAPHITASDFSWVGDLSPEKASGPVSYNAFQPGTIGSPPAGARSRCAWMSWQVPGGWDDMDCDVEMGRICMRPMSSTGKECEAPAPDPHPPHSGKAAVGCGLDNFNDRMNEVSATCCAAEAAACQGGTPNECSPACAAKWLPFMGDCGTFVSSTGLADAFSAFSTKCQTAAQASTSAGCTVSAAMPLLGSCMALSAQAFCSGTCFTRADAFMSQCEDAGGLLATYIPQMRAAVGQCATVSPPAVVPPPPPPSPGDPFGTCDISSMNSV